MLNINNLQIITRLLPIYKKNRYMSKINRQRGSIRYWSEERCLEVAKQCKTIKEFTMKFPTAYRTSIQKGWREDYTWLERSYKIDMTAKIYLIYVYEDLENNKCYVGLTNNIIKRKSSHRKTRYYKNKHGFKYLYRDAVNKHFYDMGKELPEPKILESGLNATQAQEREKYWCDFYKTHGWELLNKANTGRGSSSLGGCEKKWNYETLKVEASKYKNKEEFKKKRSNAYREARIAGWLEDYFPSGFDDLKGEKWKDIVGYEGLYQISNYKRVKHLKDEKHKAERLMAIFLKHKNPAVALRKNNVAKTIRIDKLYEKAWGK